MIGRIYHVGLTVSDLDRSVAFYRDILGLAFQGEILWKAKKPINVSQVELQSKGRLFERF